MPEVPVFDQLNTVQLAIPGALRDGLPLLRGCRVINPDGTGFGGGCVELEAIEARDGDRFRLTQTDSIAPRGSLVYRDNRMIATIAPPSQNDRGAPMLCLQLEPDVYFEPLAALLGAIELWNPDGVNGGRSIVVRVTDADGDTGSAAIAVDCTGAAPVARFVPQPTMPRDEIDRLIGSVKWFHVFEVLPGIRTPGYMWHNPAQIFADLGMPQDFSGLDCLDIGAWDGPTAFEIEARGGNVIALDIQDPDKTAFNVAKKIRGSSVEYITASVYDLDRVFGSRKFDVVAFFGVYYHLKYPIMAFEKIAGIMKDSSTLLITGELLRNYAERLDGRRDENLDIRALADSDVPLTLAYPGRYKNGSNWHVPNLACIKSWLNAAGLELIQHIIIEDAQARPMPIQALRARARKSGTGVDEHPLVGSNMWADR